MNVVCVAVFFVVVKVRIYTLYPVAVCRQHQPFHDMLSSIRFRYLQFDSYCVAINLKSDLPLLRVSFFLGELASLLNRGSVKNTKWHRYLQLHNNFYDK